MSKYSRYNSVISRNSDETIDEDYWLKKFQSQLQKEAVQPRSVDSSIFEQITTIMNGKPKYTSVEAAVEDMKNRSGLTAYLDKVKFSESAEPANTKTAENKNVPQIIAENPTIANTIKNVVDDVKGTLPVMVVLDKVKSIHYNDVSNEKLWDDDNLLIYISELNLAAKRNSSRIENTQNLGKRDINNNLDIDPANTDAFFGLNPTKM